MLFSGLTVIISLAGLWMVDNTAIRSMALGAMLVVGVAVLAATTLLPALLGRRAVRRAGQLLTRRSARDRPGLLAALDRRRDAPPGARRRR